MSQSGMEAQYNSILLATRSGTSQGQMRIRPAGIAWKKAGGGKTIDLPQQEIEGFLWSKTNKGGQLGVKQKSSGMVLFMGFKDTELEDIKRATSQFGVDFVVEEMSCSGRSWGVADVESSTLTFQVDKKPAFRVPLRDVGQVQQGKDEIALDFAIDDTTGGDHEDALVGISFHVPKETSGFPALDEDNPSISVIYNELIQYTDVGAAVGDPVATFEGAAVLAPRGRFDIELYLSFLKLTGQAQDYRIQYDSIVRIFVLPKSHTPHTLVVISLDPPIRKGQTFYQHILVQLPTDETLSVELEITDEQLAEKNEKCGGKLAKSMSGSEPEVFARLLRGLAATKLTKPGNFRTADGAAFAVRCSYKADDGYLYPLERAFFYVHKPPTLIVFDEIESVEFMRQGGGLVAASVKTFDLNVRQKNDQEFLFRGIQKQEWTNLFGFLQAKRIRIENLEEAQQGPGGNTTLDFTGLDLGEDIDTGVAAQRAKGDIEDEEEEVDEDFKEEGDDDEGDEEVEEQEEEEEEAPKKKKAVAKPKAEKPAKKAKTEKPAKKAKAEKAEKPAKKKKAKKDPNAPKRALSAFMFFSNDQRPKIREENPDLKITEVASLLGQQWKSTEAKDRTKYEKQAAEDKARYEKENTAYKAKGGGAAEDDEEDDE